MDEGEDRVVWSLLALMLCGALGLLAAPIVAFIWLSVHGCLPFRC